MKKLIIGLFTLGACLLAADSSGIWNGVGGIEDGKYGSIPQTAQLTLLQAGTSVTGSIKFGNATPVQLVSGRVSGTQITFGVASGGSGVLTLTGSTLQGRLTSSKGKILDVVFSK